MTDPGGGEGEDLLSLDDLPYGGLFGEGVLPRVIQELVADPWMDYHPADLVELTGKSPPAVRGALRFLTESRLVTNVGRSETRPIYRVDVNTRRFQALSWLAFAWADDRDGTALMNQAVADYSSTELRNLITPSIEAVIVQFRGMPDTVRQYFVITGQAGVEPTMQSVPATPAGA
jgi:hypothetical protein